jgi:hypothetical protein
MKRIVLLILVLLLLIDQAEDGNLGKATFVAPQSSAETSLISSLLPCSGKVDSIHYTLPSDGGGISRLLQFQPVMLRVQPTLKIIIYNYTSSSGGMPL